MIMYKGPRELKRKGIMNQATGGTRVCGFNPLQKVVCAALLVLGCGLWSNGYAEFVSLGDYTTPGIFDGDLVVIGGNLDLKETLTVNGDVKIIAGKVEVASDDVATTTVGLYVYGDLIVTNTEFAGGEMEASISVPTGELVTGHVPSDLLHGGAHVIQCRDRRGVSTQGIHRHTNHLVGPGGSGVGDLIRDQRFDELVGQVHNDVVAPALQLASQNVGLKARLLPER